MATSIAINGFGRIGRLVLRTLLGRYKKELAVVAINDMADLKTNAHLFRYDSTYGIYPGKIELGDGAMKVDGRNIAVLNQKEPARRWRAKTAGSSASSRKPTSSARKAKTCARS
jgi:glyceraldehyde 3-phosphate dehydrogenase